MGFFDGGLDPDREGNHDDLAEEIALASKDWANRFWRPVDTKACASLLLWPLTLLELIFFVLFFKFFPDLFRLLLEYSRLLEPERVRLQFHSST